MFLTIHLRDEQRLLSEKLAALERKIIVGGENLLDKAELQAKLLEESDKQLEQQREKREALRQQLQNKEVRIISSSCFICCL